MISQTDQTILLAVSAVIVLTTLVVVVWQLWRGRGKGGD
jgi:hypothetical protein